jgi:RimJ/RimL family protein N-acetyltransferase
MNTDKSVILRPFTVDDIDRLIGWIPSAEFLLQWAGPAYHHPLTRKQIEELMAAAAGDEPEVLLFKAIDDATGEVVGHVELLNIDRHHRLLTIGRVLVGPDELRGRGIGRQIMNAALRISFDELGMHRVGLGVFDFNSPAIACYEKTGFRREGVLRDYRRVGEAYWSLVMMSILEDEWRSAAGR